jgi:hypothetical protein
MRLGLTSSTYQYLFGGWLFPDRSKLDFNLYGQPYPYFAQTPVHVDPAQQLEWLIEKTARLELDVVHAGIALWDDPRYLDKIKSMLARHELELMPMPPNEDEDRWVDASIAYAKQAFAEFLN